MKRLLVLMVIVLLVSLACNAFALPAGKRVFEAKMGNVTFDGDTHKNAGVKCNDCHPKPFPMQKGSMNLPKPHKPGVSCGACHNGEKAFSITEGAKCGSCHGNY